MSKLYLITTLIEDTTYITTQHKSMIKPHRLRQIYMHVGIVNPPPGGGENVPGIPDACATCNFTYLARGPCIIEVRPEINFIVLIMSILGNSKCRKYKHSLCHSYAMLQWIVVSYWQWSKTEESCERVIGYIARIRSVVPEAGIKARDK